MAGSGSRTPIRKIPALSTILFVILVCASPARAYEVVHNFRYNGVPAGSLIQAPDGFFYGTTLFGGTYGAGTAFQMDALGSLTTIHSFDGADGAQPYAGLVRASDGSFYGTTSYGGANESGTVFRMDSSGKVTSLHSFMEADGANPAAPLIQATDGNFYGTTSAGGANGMGTIFRIGGSGGLTTLHSFGGSDGSAPIGALVQARDGDLYGATARGGVNGYGSVFRIDPSGNLVTLHSFDGSDGGNQPSGGLLLTSDGNFYGTTALGGTGGSGNYGNGTAFRMDPSGVVTVLHSFGDNDAHPVGPLIQARDGRFYGTALGQTTLAHLFGIGSIYQMDSSGNLTALHEFAEGEGEGPYAALLQGSDGNLYGATMLGGVNGSGTLYRATTTGTLATLYTFPLLDEGVGPQAGLLAARDGSLYGTTSDGGTGANGTVFRLGPDGVPVTLHSFGSSEGNTPYASLIQGTDGNFYGTTLGGGAQDQGTVFRMDSSGALTTLHSFGDSPSDGRYPYAALLQARDGNFYGTTPLGGTYGEGAVFRMDASGEATILHSFTPFDYQVDGGFPYAALIQAADGYLYGTTSAGGANFGGTIFRIDSNGTFTTLHSFERQEGAEPSQLMQGRDGYFYGTTSSSSFEPIGKGTVFRMDSSGKVTTLHDFSESEGGNGAPLLQASDGAFYGMTKEGSPPDYGTIFRIDTGGNFATLHRFAFSGGVYPAGALVEKSEGVLYGATSGGGPSRGGVIFRIVERADVLPVNRPRRPVRTVPPRD